MRSSLLRQFLITIAISGAVYLFMSYLLPYILPFLISYVLMRMLWPVMEFMHNSWKFPRLFSHYGTLTLFFVCISSSFCFLIYKVFCQLKLLITNFPVYQQYLCSFFEKQTYQICCSIDHNLRLSLGTARSFLLSQIELIEKTTTNFISTNAGKMFLCIVSNSCRFAALLIITVIAMIILIREMEPINKAYRNSRYYSPVHFVLHNLKKSGLTYLRTEAIILVINCLVCSFAFFLIHNPYFFVLGAAIAVFDAFPVLGSGLILVPWGILSFLSHNYYTGAILFTAYVITLFIREFLEAKLLGDGMQLNSFLMLAAIFIGIQLFGVSGILLGPLSIVLIRSLTQLALP